MKRVAFISGSSRGIGRAIAVALAREGYHVVINGRGDAAVQSTVQEIEQSGGHATAYIGDLTKPGAADEATTTVIAREGHLDLVVLNVGSGRTPNEANPAVDETRRVFEINFFAAVALAHAALPKMKAGSNLIFISSIAGCENIGAPIAYMAAKTALLAYAKGLAARVATQGIRVNSVSPGNVLFSGSTWDDKLKKDEVATRNYIASHVPMNGFASPDDIAAAVKYLAAAPFVTGHNLVVDGGQTHGII